MAPNKAAPKKKARPKEEAPPPPRPGTDQGGPSSGSGKKRELPQPQGDAPAAAKKKRRFEGPTAKAQASKAKKAKKSKDESDKIRDEELKRYKDRVKKLQKMLDENSLKCATAALVGEVKKTLELDKTTGPPSTLDNGLGASAAAAGASSSAGAGPSAGSTGIDTTVTNGVANANVPLKIEDRRDVPAPPAPPPMQLEHESTKVLFGKVQGLFASTSALLVEAERLQVSPALECKKDAAHKMFEAYRELFTATKHIESGMKAVEEKLHNLVNSYETIKIEGHTLRLEDVMQALNTKVIFQAETDPNLSSASLECEAKMKSAKRSMPK